jgi:hypothetical protein
MISAQQTNGFNGAIGLAATNRRKSDRIPGPFDAWRVGVLHTPVRIYDISLGGCFVNAMHEQMPGVIVMLEVQLPGEGTLELKAKTLYRRPGFGFAVRFINMDDQARARLARALQALGAD